MESPNGLWTLTHVLIFNCFVGSSTQQASPLIQNACFGTDPACDFFSLQCPGNSIVRFINLIAGRKDATLCPQDNHCGKSPNCCSYNSADPWATFTLEHTYQAYRNCSGRTNCADIQAPWQVINPTTGATSSYVQLEYFCDNVADKMPMCGGPFKKTSKVTYSTDIWFDGSTETFDPTRASKECKCSFTNLNTQTSTTLILDWIDVRLESHYRDVNASSAMCSSAIFATEVFFRRCKDSTEHWKDNFIHYNSGLLHASNLPPGRTTDLVLTNIHKNGPRDSPAMIWFKARAFPEMLLSINCEEVISAEFTTTTLTTTTIAQTTTTTSPRTTTTTPTTTTTIPTTTATTPTTTTTTSTTTTAIPQPTTTTIIPTTTATTPTTTTTTSTTTTAIPQPTTTSPQPTTKTTHPPPSPTTQPTTTTLQPPPPQTTQLTTTTIQPSTPTPQQQMPTTTAMPTTKNTAVPISDKKERPSMPTRFNVLFSTIKHNEVTVTWNPGFNGGPQQIFHILYTMKAESSWKEKTITDAGAKEMNFTISDLTPGTEYQAFMFSRNTIGSSGNTDIITFTSLQYDKGTKNIPYTSSIAGGIVGSLVGILIIVLLIVGLRKYDIKCTFIRKKGENETLGNSQAMRQPDHDSSDVGHNTAMTSDAGYNTAMTSKPYDSLDFGQRDLHHYSELGRQPANDKTHEYANTNVHLNIGKAVYVNTTFGEA